MTGREISDAEMLAALLPNSVADLDRNGATQHVAPLQMTVAYQPGPNGTLVPVYVPVATLATPGMWHATPGVTQAVGVYDALPATVATPATPATRAIAQPLPGWAKGVAVVSVGVGAGGWLLAGALDLISSAVAGIAAGAAAALPLLVLAGVAVAALAGRRSGGKGEQGNRSVSISQTFTNNIKIGE